MQEEIGEPLFLTPLIKKGQIEEAKQRSEVHGLLSIPGTKGYSGFLTVNEKYNSNLFFWFFKSQNQKAPILVWLQGGPGASSLFGLFVINGPYIVQKDMNITQREYSWTNEFSMLYFDQPVGTGFSFTENDAGYAKYETDVANEFYNALQQFFTLFPELRTNDFYLSGESYAGKYVPSIAYKIHTEKDANISMKGIAIGDGMSDPETMVDFGDHLYQIGLIDGNQRKHFIEQQNKAVSFIKAGKYTEAFWVFDELILGKLASKCYFKNITGFSNQYNILRTRKPEDNDYYKMFVSLPSTRKAIHVGNLSFNNGAKVMTHMLDDLMRSVKPWFSVLMDHYKVLIYTGQLDIVVTVPTTEKFLRSVQWKHREEYLNASRKIWKVDESDEEVAGYVKKVHDFYQVVVRNAGHILPYDQPRVAYNMISKFVAGNL